MSDIWIRKMRTVFRRFDFDNDGLVHRQDFVRMAERLGDLEKSNQKQKEISRQRFDELFTRYAKTSGITDVLTEGVLISSMKMQRDDPQMKKCISDAMSSLFTAMDVNNDGHLDFEEFRRAIDDVGVVDSSFARAAFDEIDVNHDGRLSFEEYIKAVIEYMCSDDENTTAALGLLF